MNYFGSFSGLDAKTNKSASFLAPSIGILSYFNLRKIRIYKILKLVIISEILLSH